MAKISQGYSTVLKKSVYRIIVSLLIAIVLLPVSRPSQAKKIELYHSSDDEWHWIDKTRAGAYTIVFKERTAFGEDQQRFEVWKAGKLLMRKDGYRYGIFSVDSNDADVFHDRRSAPKIVDMTGDGLPDLIIEHWSGGVHCCYTFDIYSLGPTFKHIWHNEAGNGHLSIKLSHKTLPEIVIEDGSYAYWPGSFAGSPMPVVYLKWQNGLFRLNRERMIKRFDSRKLFPQHPEGGVNAMDSFAHQLVDLIYSGNAQYLFSPKLWTTIPDSRSYSGHADYIMEERMRTHVLDRQEWLYELTRQLLKSPFYKQLAAINTPSSFAALNRNVRIVDSKTTKLPGVDESNLASSKAFTHYDRVCANNLAVKALELAHYEDAIERLEQLLKLDPLYETARQNLAIAYNNYAVSIADSDEERSRRLLRLAYLADPAGEDLNVDDSIIGQSVDATKLLAMGRKFELDGDFVSAYFFYQQSAYYGPDNELNRLRDKLLSSNELEQASKKFGGVKLLILLKHIQQHDPGPYQATNFDPTVFLDSCYRLLQKKVTASQSTEMEITMSLGGKNDGCVLEQSRGPATLVSTTFDTLTEVKLAAPPALIEPIRLEVKLSHGSWALRFLNPRWNCSPANEAMAVATTTASLKNWEDATECTPWRLRGDVYLSRDQYKAAEAAYKHSLSIDSNELRNGQLPMTLAALGQVYVEMGDDREAEPILKRALYLGEKWRKSTRFSERVNRSLAKLLYRQNRLLEAIDVCNQIIESQNHWKINQ
jgi:tetratricopeptide (TPR) repeat protein